MRRRTFAAGALSSVGRLLAGCSDPPASIEGMGTTGTGSTSGGFRLDVPGPADLPPTDLPPTDLPPERVDLGPPTSFDVGGPFEPIDKPPARPRLENLLFISIDDLNDYVGFMGGHPNALTPNLDHFARNATTFMNAHCAAPSCNPSRTSVMTGLRPSTTGIYRNVHPWSPVLGSGQTIPSAFRDSGFRTLGAGKLFHGNPMQPHAWHDYFPAFCDARPDDPSPPDLPANGVEGSGRMDWGPLVDKAEMGDEQVVAYITEQMARHDGTPTMFGAGLFRPHLPWYVPLRYFDRFYEDEIALPPFLDTDYADIPEVALEVFRQFGDHERIVGAGAWRESVHGYLASVAFADDMFGQLIAALESSPLADTTAVVVWSDHGWHLGEKMHWRKFSLWEEATRVPLMIRLPGVVGHRTFEPVSLVDIFPTLAELFDLVDVEHLDGTSLVPLIENPGAARAQGAITTWDAGNHSVRTRRWRYTRYLDGTHELYDHDSDPHEWVNLANEQSHSSIVASLEGQLPEGVPAAPESDDYLPDELECEVPGDED
ncbi:MAG: sulfatase [Nannocystales bacterium]